MNKIQNAVQKLEETGYVWFRYGDKSGDYTASAGVNREINKNDFYISFHKGRMPAFNAESFDSVKALAARCLEIQPDLRRWHTRLEE